MRLRLSVFVSFLILLFSFTASSQRPSERLDELYRYVEQTDSIAIKSQKTFFLEKYDADDYNYRETWRYSMRGGRIVFFQVDYILDSLEYTEVYYVNKGRLVCSEEYEKMDYGLDDDELKFGSILYFESAVPRHVVMLGRRAKTWRWSDPGDIALTRFEKRMGELKMHIPMLP